MLTKQHRTKSRPDEIDKIVSYHLKERRVMLGMSQNDISKVLDVSIQQVQKYESAKNRISSGKLYKIANFFKLPLTYFYKEIDGKKAIEIDDFDKKEVSILIKNFRKITDPKARQKIAEIITLMS
jgi:transcriptional regulator with XRE-family HTH domain